tara:strand:+ start:86 stop:955 length:870 start_codon:yes stop_codon:yes gene_type:complete
MKTIYLNAGDAAIALNFKVGSATLARSVIQTYQPELESILTTPHGDGNGTAYPEGMSVDTIRWHGKVSKCDPSDKGVVLLIVRDPVEKFRSACAEDNITDVGLHLDWLESNPEMPRRMHFWPQSRFLQSVDAKLYRFAEDLDALATDAGLTLPLPNITGEHNRPKPDFTPDELVRVQAIYADDITLFESITEAGQTWTAPPAPPEPVYVPQEVSKLALAQAIFADSGLRLMSLLTLVPPEMKDEVEEFLMLSQHIERSHPQIAPLGALLGYDTPEKLDAIFTLAKDVTI